MFPFYNPTEGTGGSPMVVLGCGDLIGLCGWACWREGFMTFILVPIIAPEVDGCHGLLLLLRWWSSGETELRRGGSNWVD